MFFINIFLKGYNFIIRKLFESLTSGKKFDFLRHQQSATQPITIDYWFSQKIKWINREAYWPVHPTSKVTGVQNILVGKGSFPGYMPGCYIQAIGYIVIGDNSIFGPNVGIISSNHDVYDHSNHQISNVVIGNNCWVGMNSVILPGVCLGDHTIVAAGSVVRNSFPEGYCIVAGNPGRVVKILDKSKCSSPIITSKFRGYIHDDHFKDFFETYFSEGLRNFIANKLA